jgi:hypothetical protein
MSEHWDDDALIRRLYGVGPEDGHLDECRECAQRWEALVEVRGRVLEPEPAPEELLAAQRRAIYVRLEQPRRRAGWFSVAPAAVATAVLVLLAVLLRQPAPAPRDFLGPSDSKLIADVYSMVQSDEPQAAEPIHALFEDGQ